MGSGILDRPLKIQNIEEGNIFILRFIIKRKMILFSIKKLESTGKKHLISLS